MELPPSSWQVCQPDYELRRELSQVTKRGSESKPHPAEANTSTSSNNAKFDAHTSIGTPVHLQSLDDFHFLDTGVFDNASPKIEKLSTTGYNDIDNEDYLEFMKNLSPCSSICTKTSQVIDIIPFNAEALSRLLMREDERLIDMEPPNNDTNRTSDTHHNNHASHENLSTNPAAVTYGDTKIELLKTVTCQKVALTLNDLVDYIEVKLHQEIQLHDIPREQLLQTLTVNHLLVYILEHLQPDISNHKSIEQIRLFHLGRSYVADRGISDPRYFTSQYLLKDLKLEQSPCFHLFISDEVQNKENEFPSATTKSMLLKSFLWREIVHPVEISATYAEAIVKKIRKVKSSMILRHTSDSSKKEIGSRDPGDAELSHTNTSELSARIASLSPVKSASEAGANPEGSDSHNRLKWKSKPQVQKFKRLVSDIFRKPTQKDSRLEF